MMWSMHLGRFVCTKEQFAAMGFPVFRCLANAAEVPVLSMPPGTYSQRRRGLGNTMHVANVGVVLALALSCIQVHKTRPLLQ